MNIKKLVIDITKDRIKVYVNGEAVSGIDSLSLNITSEPEPTVSGIIKAFRKVGSTDLLKISDVTSEYASVFGPYITPYTNNLVKGVEDIHILEDPTGEFSD